TGYIRAVQRGRLLNDPSADRKYLLSGSGVPLPWRHPGGGAMSSLHPCQNRCDPPFVRSSRPRGNQPAMDIAPLLDALHLPREATAGGSLDVRSPIDGEVIAQMAEDDAGSLEAKIARAQAAFLRWREVPAPRRGELIRLFGEELRAHKDALGRLVTVKAGKIVEEGRGEVQEMIDICDFAVGLSRQLYGLTIASERPGHAL